MKAMKRLSTVLLLAAFCILPAIPSSARSNNDNSTRAMTKAEKKQQKAQKKYAKRQKKAADKMFKNSQKNTHYPKQTF